MKANYLTDQADKKFETRGELRVTGEQVLVNYTVPMSPPKLKDEKNPVLDIVRYGGPMFLIPH